MIILDVSHHDLEVVYQYIYRKWRKVSDDVTHVDYLDLSGRVETALDNLRAAGYTPEQIARLERGALYTRQRIDQYLDEGE